MNDLQQAFESELRAAWQNRDFAAWLETRRIYADWLEENYHVLYRMARCPLRMRPYISYLRNGAIHIWAWRLLFDLPYEEGNPESWGKPRPKWWKNRRVNAKQILGFPAYTMRCVGWEEETHTVRFIVRFKKMRHTRIVSNARYNLSGYSEVPLAVDTDAHREGFPALFWTPASGIVREVTPDDVKRERVQMELWP